MGLFKKQPLIINTELKCVAEGCKFVCNDVVTMKRHVDWIDAAPYL